MFRSVSQRTHHHVETPTHLAALTSENFLKHISVQLAEHIVQIHVTENVLLELLLLELLRLEELLLLTLKKAPSSFLADGFGRADRFHLALLWS